MKIVSCKRLRLVGFNRVNKITILLFLALVFVFCLYIFNVPIRTEFIYTPIYVNMSLDQPVHWKQRLMYESKRPVVIGEPITTAKFLTIGISSIFRPENYLKDTLESFIKESTPEERENVTIIVYLADLDSKTKNFQVTMLRKYFQPHLDSGFLHLIYSEQQFDLHPPLSGYRRTYNDSVQRVQWRSKQALDFAFLLSYASNMTEYYMVMEDDILPAPGYLSTIRNYIEAKNGDAGRTWIALEFTEFVCIGLTLHSRELEDLAEFLLIFYEEQPVDFLMRQFLGLQVPDPWSIRRRVPSIFQHVGSKSTLYKKKQKSRDFSFETAKRKLDNKNPPAKLTTTMMIHEDCVPQNAYERIPGIFWGIPTRKTDYLTIHFQTPVPVTITRVYIRSGGRIAKRGEYNVRPKTKDMIPKGAGELEYSDELACKKFSKLESFSENSGILDITLFSPLNVTCLRVATSNRNNSWVIISEIEIFTETETRQNKRDGFFLFL